MAKVLKGFFGKQFEKAVDGVCGPAAALTMKASLGWGELPSALRHARQVDECLRYGNLQDLFVMRYAYATNIMMSAPPPKIHMWLKAMSTLLESELLIRSEASLAWMRTHVLANKIGVQITLEEKRKYLAEVKVNQEILGKRSPDIAAELAKAVKILEWQIAEETAKEKGESDATIQASGSALS